jgi:hypothetical protein
MTEEAHPDPARKPRRLRYQKQPEPGSVGTLIGVTLTLTLGTGVVLVLLSGALTPSQGARASTRLQWAERRAEIDRAVEQAQAEGKLHP